MVTLRIGILAVAFVLAVAGCQAAAGGESDDPIVTDLETRFDIEGPAPDDVVLTVSIDPAVHFSLNDLAELDQVSIRVVEPFIVEEVTFTGVYLAEVLALAGVPANTRIDTIALNDYRYQDDLSALIAADPILATAVDGAPIPLDSGGPIRIVFDTPSPYFDNLAAWNWSLRYIEIVAP